jgi:hypothetical protein
MNALDLELFDHAANQLHKCLKELDKFYPNEKSLANYLEGMSNLPPEQWKRFEPIKSETERATLQNISAYSHPSNVFISPVFTSQRKCCGFT